ncbi:carbohydrate-binding protein [Fulvivirga maritima]|uniref:carbohydrate-binding protein n=1 Tax=Fulvivirga maritima TaxID=2904247 RepID=UPI001F250C7F|nr:carbohydrate-binding protein [Fulvivirga maritima]UII26689.1 carbohydrate-binding protein [Fulvivirga maritima]
MPEAHGFTATVNGESAEIESVELGEEAHQVVNIYMAEEIHYGDEILISYNGTNLQTTEGVTLAAITDLSIDIFLDGDRLPLAVPGQIEVEDYFVNNGFEWEEAEDEGGGLNLSYTDAGDYLDFAVNVEEEGYYEVEYRVSSQDEGGTVALFTLNEEDQENEISRVSFEKTDDWQAWVTVNGSVADLSQGFQRIRLKAITSLFNVNWIRLNYIGASLPTGVEDNIALNYTIYPNPADGAVNVRFTNSVEDKQISLRDHSGKVLFTQEVPQGREQIEIEESLAAGLYFITVTDADESYTQKIIIR